MVPYQLKEVKGNPVTWKHPIPELNVPKPPHPGAFGVQRKHHVHEGVDLYCHAGTFVQAVEPGVVVEIMEFTGPEAKSPWWLPTKAVLVEGPTGVVLYGEIEPLTTVGKIVFPGSTIGMVKHVLKEDKGYGTSMLHLELHDPGTREVYEWTTEKPPSLRDPTPYLEAISNPQPSEVLDHT